MCPVFKYDIKRATSAALCQICLGTLGKWTPTCFTTIACYSQVRGALSHASPWMNKCFTPADLPLCLCAVCVCLCTCVCMFMRATAAVPPLREIKFHKMWWMPVSAEPAVCMCMCVCVCVCVFVNYMFVSAFLCACACIHVCRKRPCLCPEGWVRLGEVMLRSGMLWVGLVIIVTAPSVPTDQANAV